MTPRLPVAEPAACGFDPARLERACGLLKKWAAEDKIPSAGICVGRRGRMVEPRFFGPVKPDALFLTASLTKPLTVTAAMMLVERGLLALEDRVSSLLPAFKHEAVQVRHLMTHTSGLPDMLPDNEKLRKAHKPLAAFVDGACKVPLLFAPGTRVSYQSMGTLLLAEIVHQASGKALRDFLAEEVFGPLGMADTSLGWVESKKARIARVRVAEETDWGWNSAYWLGLGAPWGGMLASPTDLGRFAQMMLNGGELDGTRLLSRASVREMTTNQLETMPTVPEEDRRCRPWGLGWRLDWPAYSSSFGDLLGVRAYGHWGATGTLWWMDPDAEAWLVLLTTQPQEPEGRFLARVSNAVAAALA
ncbi:MAG: beta-lactamase family protein [Gemmataceae bacterium]|nr:beta-lactamase family protein [Gemmataceae bacterium]